MIDRVLRTKIIEDRVKKGRTVAELSSEYGVSPASISRWTGDYLKNHNAHDLSDLSTETDNMIRRLSEENKKLREENEGLRLKFDTLQKLLIDIYSVNSAQSPLDALSNVPGKFI